MRRDLNLSAKVKAGVPFNAQTHGGVPNLCNDRGRSCYEVPTGSHGDNQGRPRKSGTAHLVTNLGRPRKGKYTRASEMNV